jgi:pimeloyl-ACP methyl ester carboxylesterase
VLVLQALEDRIAPKGNADILESELDGRVERVDVESAGHALLPEQPEAIADAISRFVRANAG